MRAYHQQGGTERKLVNGYVIRDKDGCIRHKTTVYGAKASYIKINLNLEEKVEMGVVVDAPAPEEFEEQKINW